MITARPQGTPSLEFPRIAAEYYENTPEAMKLKSRVSASKRLREATMRAELTEIFSSPDMSVAEKLEAKRKIESRMRIADKTDQAAAQLRAYRDEYQGTAKRDLSQAFSERPDQAFTPQEINYSPGMKFTGNLKVSKPELEATERARRANAGDPFNTEEEIAAIRAGGGQLVPKGLGERYSVERRADLEAFEARETAGARADFLGKSRFNAAQNRANADISRARGQGVPQIDTNQFRFNSGGTINRGGDAFDVEPGMGYRPASPYGMEPEAFVTAPRAAPRFAPVVPAYPIINRGGRGRPAAGFPDGEE